MDLGLAGRRALITGSYRGTGAGIARVLADEGATVVVHGFDDGQPDAVANEIAAAGGTVETLVADFRTDEGAAAALGAVGHVDVLVNNYGAPVGSSWTEIDRWADEWNTNVVASVRATQACLRSMRERGWGRVIFLGTTGTRQPGVRNPGYYAAKSGLHTLVRTLAMECRGTGVTANLVSPGMIATAEVREMMTRRAARAGVDGDWAAVEAWASEHAWPNLTERIPDPEDIGRFVAFVASDAAWHVNGADLPIDGGAPDA